MISNDVFLEKEFPDFNPITQRTERINYWREIKRRCMEGYWVGGKWMPGELYTYCNIWHIKLNDASRKNAGKVIARPWLRDIEWEKAYIATEAYGFSGFTNDTENTCDRRYDPKELDFNISIGLITAEEAAKKNYIPAYDYLRRNHGKDLGKPLYENQAKNVIDIEARGGGKSYWASVQIFHNFAFDGSHDYDAYITARQNDMPMTSETLVGAISAQYSNDLMDKYINGVDHLPGSFQFQDDLFPSPLAISVTGTYADGKKGAKNTLSGSKLHHRTFHSNPFAGNGTRPSKAFLEEIGLFGSLIETLGAMKDTTMDGSFKFGTIWMFGTGGDMAGGSTEAAKKVFYNPEEFDCLSFEDTWEGKGKIGMFVPADFAINDFKKGPEKITDFELADLVLTKERDRLKKAKSQVPFQAEQQNRPRKPSEAFLTTGQNKFPGKDLDLNLERIRANPRILASNWTGFVTRDPNDTTKIRWKNTDDRPFREHPPDIKYGEEGCIEIFVHPKTMKEGLPFPYRYIAAVDPVDDDGLEGSLQCCLIMDLYTETIVAEYTGRTEVVDDWYENCRLLLMYYNAICLYENNKKGFYTHFRNKNSLHLLAKTPEVLYSMDVSKSRPDALNKSYGVVATAAINEFGRQVYNTWLRKQAVRHDEGITNAMMLNSLGLTVETRDYNADGNFDRVSAAEKLFILYADMMFYLGGVDAVWGDTTSLPEKKPNRVVEQEDDIYSRHMNRLKQKGLFSYGEKSEIQRITPASYSNVEEKIEALADRQYRGR